MMEALDRLGVPAGHAFYGRAMRAWWFVPARHEPEFARALEALWLRDGRGGPGLEFFRGVVPARDLGPFEHFFLGLLEKKSQEWRHAAGNRADPS
jgi:hypothetical protein